jgi:hypothetical protein
MSENFNYQNDNAIEDESIVDGVRRELEEIDATDLSEHAARFDALHKKLQDSLNSIDGL